MLRYAPIKTAGRDLGGQIRNPTDEFYTEG